MLTLEQMEERKNQVGASDVYYLLNFDNKKPKDLWLEKIGRKEMTFFENIYTRAGNIVEEPCLVHYLEPFKEPYTLGERVEHKDIKRFVSSTDGLVNGVPVENKTIKAENYKENMMNKQYYTQLQAQIACTNADKGIILYNLLEAEDYEHPLLYEPKQFVHVYDRDDELIEEIESRVQYFLQCMDNEVEPNEKDYGDYCGKEK